MADVPYPLTAEDLEGFKSQVNNLIRELFEERIAGANLGDVFSIAGDVLTLDVSSTGGLQKTSNELEMKLTSTGGLTSTSSGAGIKLKTTASGLTVDANGLYVTDRAFETASTTWDPAILDIGESTSTNVTVTGAAVGDPAIAAITTNTSERLVVSADVTAADTVTVTLTNHSLTDNINLGSGTLTVMVWT